MVVLERGFSCVRGVVVVGLAVIALAGAGCGSDDDDGGGGDGGSAAADTASGGGGDGDGGAGSAADDAAGIRATFKTYVDSLFASDYEKACDQATASERHAVRVISKLPCEAQFRSVFKVNPLQLPKPRVMSVKVDGERAIARLDTGDASRPYRMRMRKVDGVWKIDNSLVTDASRRKAKQEGRL